MATFAANPLIMTLTAPAEPYQRADLEFHGLDHSKASFEGRLFINNPGAGPETSTGDPSYIGSFWVFGHGGCAGDEGHCEPPSTRRPFDFRAEHQLTPVSKRVIITEKLRTLVRPGDDFTVRVVPFVRPENADPLPASLVTDLLQFDRVELLSYQ
jgi:tyrosinase